MRGSRGGGPEGPDTGPAPGAFVRLAMFLAAAAAGPSPAFAAAADPNDHLSTVLGGFVFVGALILVFMRMRHSRRGSGGDTGVVGAIDHIIDGDERDGGDDGGDAGDGGGGD